MEDRLPRKLAAILYADVAGYSRLTGEDEEGTHRRLSAYLDAFTAAIQGYEGRVVHFAGDAILAEFPSVSQALTCAAAVQNDLKARNEELPEERRIRFRIGVNLGEVIVDRNDIYGDGVNVAARLETLAEPGGICVSESVRNAVGSRLPLSYDFLGEQEVKNIRERVRAYRVKLDPEATLPAPSAARKPARPVDRRTAAAMAAGLLLVLAGVLAWLEPWAPRVQPASLERMAFPLPEAPSIAVLPFSNLSGDPGQEYFSDGLTNDIITDLSKFANLFVIASDSSFAYKNMSTKTQTVSEELGVRYVLQGSVQRLASRVRINAQLIDALTGRHLWAERYDRDANDLLAAQSEIVETVVAALAIEVDAAERERVSRKETESLLAYDHYLRAADIRFDWEKGANERARQLLEKAVELDPNYARAYAALAWTHVNDWRWGWTEDAAASKELALKMARKAIQLDPFDPESHWALGVVHLYSRQFDKAMPLYERAVALNPNDARLLVGTAPAWIYIGRVEEAVAQMERGMRLNPHYSDEELGLLGWAHYEAKQYDKTLTTLLRISEPETWIHRVLAATYVRLGRLEDARAQAAIVLNREPDYSIEKQKVFPYKDEVQRQHYTQALVEAGIPEKPPLPLPDKPSIVVLPFDNLSDDPDQEYFADGMTDDLITDLSKISGLFVIARNSSFTYKGKPVKERQVAEELGVRYVLEGSIRRSGEQVRVNAQLIDATTGGHVWADRYDGSVADIFSLQDAFIREIVKALAVNLSEDEQEEIALGQTSNIEAREAFQKGWESYLRYSADDNAAAISQLETALELDPEYGRAYAALGLAYLRGCQLRWNKPLKMSVTAANQKALTYLNETKRRPSSLANVAASGIYLYNGRYEEAVTEATRAIAQDPNDPEAYIAMAWAMITTGRPEPGLELVERAMRLNPTYPNYYVLARGMAYFAVDDLEKAADVFEKALERNAGAIDLAPPLAATYARIGQREDARASLLLWKPGATQDELENIPTSYHFPYQWSEDREIQDRLRDGLYVAALPLETTISSLAEATKHGNLFMRRRAILDLGRFGSTAVPAIPALIEALGAEELAIRNAAAIALGKIGPAAEAAISALTAMRGEGGIVGDHAGEALRKIKGK